jgi:hypothetical protein
VPDGVDETVAAAHLVSAAAREVEEIEAEIERLERMGPPADLPVEIPEGFEVPSAQS